MQTTKVIDDDIRKSKMHESRQANGTWVKHQDDAVVEIFRRAQRVTGFNLDLAEDWQVSVKNLFSTTKLFHLFTMFSI